MTYGIDNTDNGGRLARELDYQLKYSKRIFGKASLQDFGEKS